MLACLGSVGQRGTHQTCAQEPSCLLGSFACLLDVFGCWLSCLCFASFVCAALVHTALLVPLALREPGVLVVSPGRLCALVWLRLQVPFFVLACLGSMGREERTNLVLMSPPAPLGLLLVCALWCVPAVLPFACRLLSAFPSRWPCGLHGVFLLCHFVAALSGAVSAFPFALHQGSWFPSRALLLPGALCSVRAWPGSCRLVCGFRLSCFSWVASNEGLHLRSACNLVSISETADQPATPRPSPHRTKRTG